jgi:hypothetical protein
MTNEEYNEMLWLETKQDRGTITVDEKEQLSQLHEAWCFDQFSKPEEE